MNSINPITRSTPVRIGILGAAAIVPSAIANPARGVHEAQILAIASRDQSGQTQDPTGQSDSEPLCLSQFFSPTPSPTRTPTPTRTSTPTRTPTNTRQPSPTPLYVKVNVYFVSKYRYENNLPP